MVIVLIPRAREKEVLFQRSHAYYNKSMYGKKTKANKRRRKEKKIWFVKQAVPVLSQPSSSPFFDSRGKKEEGS